MKREECKVGTMVRVTCGEHKSAIGIIKEDDGTGTLPIRVRYIDETGYDFYEPFELEPYSCTDINHNESKMKTTFEPEELKNITLHKGSTAYIKSSQGGVPVVLGVEVDHISYDIERKTVEVTYTNHHSRTQECGTLNLEVFFCADDANMSAIREYERVVQSLKRGWESAEAHLEQLKKNHKDKNYIVK